MAPTHPLLLLPGDGIGPEVTAQARRVAEWFMARGLIDLHIEEAPFGGGSYDLHGVPVTDETMALAHEMGVVLLGAVGGPAWEGVDFALRPEAALLRIRKEMDLFANLRPALCFSALADSSSLKRPLVEGLDILILRELTGGVYFGEPRGIETLADGVRRGVNTQVYDSREIRRIAAMAFELARKRTGRVTSVEKRNVMESGLLWHEEVVKLHAEAFADIELDHMLADNCAMQLVRRPGQFDVIVTDNLFGDMLSDIAAMLTGSLGMLPSASLGALGADGRRPALYEPVHGSAPDIAGRGVANPLATILSFAMALRYSFDAEDCADLLEEAVSSALEAGCRTADIAQAGEDSVSTGQMGSAVVAELEAAADRPPSSAAAGAIRAG